MHRDRTPTPADVFREGAALSAPAAPGPMWSVKGRIGRLRYFVRTGLSAFAYLLAVLLVGMLLGSDLDDPSTRDGLILAALALPALAFVAVQSVQRARDLGWPAWVGACVVTPCFGSILAVVLLFAPGSAIRNQHGPPPTANGRALVIAGWIIGALLLALLVADTLEG